MAKRTVANRTIIKIGMPISIVNDKERKELVEYIANILRRSRLSTYTPQIMIECGRHKKIIDLG